MKRNEMWFRFGPTVKLVLLCLALSLLTSLVGIWLYALLYGLTHPGWSMQQVQDSMTALYEMEIQDIGMIWSIYIAWKHKVIRIPDTFRFPASQRRSIWIPLLAGILFFLGDACFESLCGIRMPEDLDNAFVELSHSPFGFLMVCLIGPLIEELIMREGVMGSMLRRGVSPWTAIIVSSVLFGVMHFNLSQSVFATIGGIALGILYYKSGNIILPLIVHALNNTFSNISTLTAETDNPTELLGGQVMVYILLALFWTISGFLFVKYWKSAPAQSV